ncbi:5'-nucleotidase, lipoprotein e(P4) family [Priestia megaterium]|uniref:5'-nucleotidase, lipoprotein e(P4) family n=1 Tax=Priestia megaterium TaxID=1404 RepID=UPI00189087B1|nr:5'-nucleotidase, lipoprotein e(P4) family [Priestia megaterium]
MKKLISILSITAMSLSLMSFSVSAQQSTNSNPNLQEQNTMSVLWFQTSGEAKALFHQGYNIGKMRLDEIIKKKPKNNSKKIAVVLDLDETVLDNSPYQAWSVVTGKAYGSSSWTEWVNKAEAKALPGAIDFLSYANSKGVDIYYISNRKEKEEEPATIKNLQRIGAPQADPEHVLLIKEEDKGKKDEKVKDKRRQQVARTHRIALFFGDNLTDFSGFDNLSVAERNQAVNKRKDEFGKKLIVFPNPMYGNWEDALYGYKKNLTDAQKAKIRKRSLQPFSP